MPIVLKLQLIFWLIEAAYHKMLLDSAVKFKETMKISLPFDCDVIDSSDQLIVMS